MKWVARGAVVIAAAALAALAIPALADLSVAARLVEADDRLPGITLPPSPVNGALDGSVAVRDYDDVYAVRLDFNQRLSARMTGTNGTDFDLWLWKPGSPRLDVRNPLSYVVQASSTENTSTEEFWYPASSPGTYSVNVVNWNDAKGTYRLEWDIVQLPTPEVSTTAPAYVKWGAGATIRGTATMDGTGLGQPRIMIAARPVGSNTWSHLNKDREASSVTYGMPLTVANSRGEFSYTVRPVQPTEYRAIVWATRDRGMVYGAPRLVSPRAVLTTPQAPSIIRGKNTFTVTGYLTPKHKTGARDVRIRFYKLDTRGVYVLRKTVLATNMVSKAYPTKTRLYRKTFLPSKGKWKIVTYVAGDSKHASGTSVARYVTVK